jgi:hypothetical protein
MTSVSARVAGIAMFFALVLIATGQTVVGLIIGVISLLYWLGAGGTTRGFVWIVIGLLALIGLFSIFDK